MICTGLVTVIFSALLLMGCVMYPGIGARFITPQAVLQAFPHFDPQNFDHNVIVRLRLPRLTTALLIGTSLGAAGALLQVVIRNPLGGPHILGLNAGATLAVVVANVLGLAFPVGYPLLASTGGVLLFLLILLPSPAERLGLTPVKATLCGVALPVLVSLITAVILILDEQTLLTMRTRLAGDLAGQDWATPSMPVWFSLGGFVLAPCFAPSLNTLAPGDRMAQGLGVSVLRMRILTLPAIALLCGAAVSVAGPIGFIGLLVPRIARRLASADLRVLLSLPACVGVLLLLLADTIAQTLLTSYELTTGVVTALVGVPVFVIMATRMLK